MAKSGVYEILNTTNSKRYVGSAVDTNARLATHYNNLYKGIHQNRYLQNAWNKYGENAFQFNNLLYCDRELLLVFEQLAIDQRSEYNLCPKAGSRLGFKHSPESIALMQGCQNAKGHIHTPEQRANISRGRANPSLKTRAKHSAATRKRFKNPEQRREQSEMMKRNWQDPNYRANQVKKHKGQPSWNKGIPLSAEHGAKIAESNRRRGCSKETKAKMSAAHVGYKHTEESKKKMSVAQKGKIISKENRQKIGDAHRGKIISVETRQKISDGLKARYARNKQ